MRFYRAPWSRLLLVMSVLSTAIVGVAATLLDGRDAAAPSPVAFGLHLVLIAIVPGAALFTVWGYRITSDAIHVRRLLWTTRLPRHDFLSAEVNSTAMSGALRVFGNGGLFSFTGLYRTADLGVFRAYVTDPKRAVVLRFAGRLAVVSPDDPEAFVAELRRI